MTQAQEEFLIELKSNPKSTARDYARIYKKHSNLAIEKERSNGANEHQAKAMGNYYTVSVLVDFIVDEGQIARILSIQESM